MHAWIFVISDLLMHMLVSLSFVGLVLFSLNAFDSLVEEILQICKEKTFGHCQHQLFIFLLIPKC